MTIPTTGKRDQNENEKKNDRSRLVYDGCVVYSYMDADVYEVLEWLVHTHTAAAAGNPSS